MPIGPRARQSSAETQTSRRTFLKGAAALGAGLVTGFPAILRGQNLNDKLNLAVIGCGGRAGRFWPVRNLSRAL